MQDDPRLTPLAAALPATVPFVGPEAQERARNQLFRARLGANESGFGPSPQAIRAMQDAAAEVWKYGDPGSYDLQEALSAHHQIPAANIMVGEGIDSLLGLLVRLLISKGDNVVTSAGAYPTFNYHVTGFGGTIHTVPYAGDYEDPDRLIAKAKDVGAKLIYMSNPDNPMGSAHSAETMARMIAAVPEGALLILDEAYLELAPDGTTPAVSPDDPRVIRMRTFSKGYGLAGARVGYAIGAKPLMSAFNKVRNHFGLSRLSQAGALAALADQEWLQSVQSSVASCRDHIGKIALAHGLTPLTSATNFVTIDCAKDGAFARSVLSNLIAQGIFVRMPFVAPQDRCIRVGCAPQREIDAFAEALPAALNAANNATIT